MHNDTRLIRKADTMTKTDGTALADILKRNTTAEDLCRILDGTKGSLAYAPFSEALRKAADTIILECPWEKLAQQKG